MRRSLAVLAMGPVLMANQCFRAFAVRVSPGPEPRQAVFTGVFEKEAVELRSLRVSLCRPLVLQHAVWELDGPADGGGARTDSVVYGAPPSGFFSEKPAEPLRAGGCYEVSAGGRLGSGQQLFGSGGFHLLADGRVQDGTGPLSRRLGGERQVDRGAVGCRRRYRRARTPADTAAVDARAWAVADTSITCGFLRERSPETIAQAKSTERTLLEGAGWIAALAALSALQHALKH
jgi:hypothetical protein